MKNKYVFVAVLLACILVVSLGLTSLYISGTEQEKEQDAQLVVVTSFYPMYIAALNVIGDTEGVLLENLSEPQTGCLHDFQLTPADMRLLSEADIFILNGGGIENFMEDVAASYPELTTIEACENIELLEPQEGNLLQTEHQEHADSADHEEDWNAHAWMSIRDYRMQVATIAEHLEQLDPVHAQQYAQNVLEYDAKLQQLQDQQQILRENLQGKKVILFHEAYAYLAEDYGMEVSYILNLDEERQVSAGEVADVIAVIEEEDIAYIFAEEQYGSDLGRTVSEETGVQVIYLDTLNRGNYEPDSYLNGMQSNMDLLLERK